MNRLHRFREERFEKIQKTIGKYTERKRALSLTVEEAWLSYNLIVALVCSLRQTASSWRAELCRPEGARHCTDYSLDSNITNNHYSQETTDREH